jgi:hypothetical protein
MSCVPHASVVGSLMYAPICTRPSITHVVGFLSKYMSKPRKEHWTTIKGVFKYLHGNSNYAIFYQGIPRPHTKIDI